MLFTLTFVPLFTALYFVLLKNEEEEEKVWEQVLKIYRDETLPTDQRLIALSSLGNIESKTLIQRYLDMSLDEKEVRGQDSLYVFGSLSDNPDAREILWNFFTTNFDLLHTKYSKSLSLFGSAVRSSVAGFDTFEKISEVEAFFNDKDTKEYARPLETSFGRCSCQGQVARKRSTKRG